MCEITNKRTEDFHMTLKNILNLKSGEEIVEINDGENDIFG